MKILKIIISVVLGVWVLSWLLHLLGFLMAAAFGMFHILIVIAIILFVVDWLMGARNKVS